MECCALRSEDYEHGRRGGEKGRRLGLASRLVHLVTSKLDPVTSKFDIVISELDLSKIDPNYLVDPKIDPHYPELTQITS